MEQFWNQLEGMHEAKRDILSQLGELYMKLEHLEAQGNSIKKTINSLRSQYSMLLTTYDSMKSSLVQNLGLKDGVYSIDFVNRRIVPNGQISDIGNSQLESGNRSGWSGSDGGDANGSYTEVE